MSLSRRTLLGLLPAAAVWPRTLFSAQGHTHRLWIGTGTNGTGSRGIYLAEWDGKAGKIGEPVLCVTLESPTFLAKNARGTNVYALSEMAEGKVTAFRTDASDGLTLIDAQPTKGSGPAHVSVHPNGRSVFAANYGGGSICSYKVRADGGLSEPVSFFEYHDATRKSHAHCVTPSPDGKWLLVNDLGLDRILVYRIHPETAELTPNDPPYWSAREGSGPRHLVFHPNGRWVYNVNEQDSTVDLLYWDAEQGTLKVHGSFVSTLPDDWPPHTAFPSEILVSPDGRFVYVGNRRNETIAVLSVDKADGALRKIQLAPHGGKSARHVTLDPSGRWLLVANQDTGEMVVFARDARTGKLTGPVQKVPLASPQCLIFAS